MEHSATEIKPEITANTTAIKDNLQQQSITDRASLSREGSRTYDPDGYCRRAAVLAWCNAYDMRDGASDSQCDRATCGGASPDVEQLNNSEESSSSGLSLRILLVASSRRPDCWILPGGGIDAGESESAAAVREAHEEGGAIAAVDAHGKPLVRYLATVTNEDKKTRTRLFALRVARLEDGGYEDCGRRQRMWANLQQAQLLTSVLPAQRLCFAECIRVLGWMAMDGMTSSAGLKDDTDCATIAIAKAADNR